MHSLFGLERLIPFPKWTGRIKRRSQISVEQMYRLGDGKLWFIVKIEKIGMSALHVTFQKFYPEFYSPKEYWTDTVSLIKTKP